MVSTYWLKRITTMRALRAVCLLLVLQSSMVYAQSEVTNQRLFDITPFLVGKCLNTSR